MASVDQEKPMSDPAGKTAFEAMGDIAHQKYQERKEENDLEREMAAEARRGRPRELSPAELAAKEKADRVRKNEESRKYVQKASKHFDKFKEADEYRKNLSVNENTQKVRVRRRVEGFDVVTYQKKGA